MVSLTWLLGPPLLFYPCIYHIAGSAQECQRDDSGGFKFRTSLASNKQIYMTCISTTLGDTLDAPRKIRNVVDGNFPHPRVALPGCDLAGM